MRESLSVSRAFAYPSLLLGLYCMVMDALAEGEGSVRRQPRLGPEPPGYACAETFGWPPPRGQIVVR